jgi:glycosyltransferase involved in cell wall biosynthesis
VHDRRRVLLIVARLTEAKGLLPFLEGVERIKAENRSKFTLVIAGSGHLQTTLEQWIAKRNLDVRLLGQQTQDQMAALYAHADGFCLPSISDPNPISVIEALWARLPLLISSRVGNHPECLEAGKNGFLFDPEDPESISVAISQWLALSPADLERFGESSLRVAHSKFDPDTVISNFLASILPGTVNASEKCLGSTMAAR